jgi:nucleotide-binding universal stress UspA family protein
MAPPLQNCWHVWCLYSAWKEIAVYTKILLPLDGSEVAQVALPHAVKMARMFKAEIILLRVAYAPPYPGSEPIEAQRAVVAESDAYLKEVAASLQGQGLTPITSVRYGHAAEEIIAFASHADVSLIIMATHGRSGVGRWLLGSTAERVLRGTAVPVLLIRASQEPAPQHTSVQ